MSAAQDFIRQSADVRAVIDEKLGLLDIQIEETMKTLQEEQRALRERRNAASAICVLPVETLSEILRIDACDAAERRDESVHGYVGRLAHVCRRWRAIVLDDSRLWTRMTVMNKQLTNLWLSRSGNAPIEIRFPGRYLGLREDDKDIPFAAQSLGHMSRVRHLEMEFGSATTADQVLAHEAFGMPAPQLEFLSLGIYGPTPIGEPVDLPVNLFAGLAPRLRTVCLEGYSMTWTSPLFSNLTNLDLVDLRDAKSRATVQEMLDIFRSCPRMTTVHLHNALRSSRDGKRGQATADTVRLSFLKSFSFGDNEMEHASLLDQIAPPPTIDASVRYEGLFTWPDFEAVLAKIESLLSQDKRGPLFDNLRVTHISTYLHIGLSSVLDKSRLASPERDYPPTSYSTLPTQRVALAFRLGQMASPTVVLALVKSTRMNFDDLRRLDLTGSKSYEHLTLAQWKEICQLCPLIRLVSISGKRELRSLAFALTPDDRHEPIEDDYLRLPSLVRLEVHFARFKGASTLERLLNCLSRRSHSGAELPELSFEQCSGFQPAYPERMKNVVGKLEWDGNVDDDIFGLWWDSDDGVFDSDDES